ncbi:MAG: hypothetical protein M3Q32_06840, partial [Pseudomonadota bacterium]|nr:hypothetical protein [Pseudomonadota bacterium]
APALVESLNSTLTSGQMTTAYKNSLVGYLNGLSTSSDGGRARVQNALYLVITSPQYQVQK